MRIVLPGGHCFDAKFRAFPAILFGDKDTRMLKMEFTRDFVLSEMIGRGTYVARVVDSSSNVKCSRTCYMGVVFLNWSLYSPPNPTIVTKPSTQNKKNAASCHRSSPYC